tara:strand:- start:583 stop:2091 length:1509 start_codon:yes stop_codon:yes gene_type:complete
MKPLSFIFNSKIFVISLLFLIILSNHSYSSQNCDSTIFDNINKNIVANEYEPIVEYNEMRNDVGIFYDFEWDNDKKEIILKRDNENNPVLRFSLFEKNFLTPSKSTVISFNDIKLSDLSDRQIIDLHRKNGTNKITLKNGNSVNIVSKPYYLNDFKLKEFDLKSINNIDTTKGILEVSFEAKLTNDRNDIKHLLDEEFKEFYGIEPICAQSKIDLNWPIETVIFNEFKYDADIREGLKNKELLVKSVFDLIYENGSIKSERTERGVASFRQYFDFKKFPFDTQKLLIQLKTDVGNWQNFNNKDVNGFGSVTFITPETGVFLNLLKFKNPEINKLKAWSIPENGIQVKSNILIDDNHYDTDLNKIIPKYESTLEIELTIERNFQHYLLKIMLPVFLILCVAWYVLWIPTEKYEVRLNTSIIALLALIAYNFVFQDDIPKLEYLTDLDWFILISYIFCCIPVFLSIAFSKFISKNQKKVTKINRTIKLWGILVYFLINGQIFIF